MWREERAPCSHTIRPAFNDRIWCLPLGFGAGAATGRNRPGFYDLLGHHLSVYAPNPAVKASGLVGGMLAGADSITGLDLPWHGGMARLFRGVRAVDGHVFCT